MIKIYHNNKCSKSRAALRLLQEGGYDFEIIEYLLNIPTRQELKDVLKKLDISALDLVRKNEDEYKKLIKDKELTEDKIICYMLEYPKLIERPIIIKGDKACIARPIDNLINLLK